jgi:hypothetical protein
VQTIKYLAYDSSRSLHADTELLAIEKLQFNGLSLSGIETDISVANDTIAIDQFVAGFLDGKIYGSVNTQLNTPKLIELATIKSPMNPYLFVADTNFKLQLTRLNTHKLIEQFPGAKDRLKSWSLVSDPYLDASLNAQYNLVENDLQGNVEITAIGKEQLRMLLYFIDPTEKDTSIATVRNLLNWGEVKQVSVPIRNGEAGMSFEIAVLAAPVPTRENVEKIFTKSEQNATH